MYSPSAQVCILSYWLLLSFLAVFVNFASSTVVEESLIAFIRVELVNPTTGASGCRIERNIELNYITFPGDATGELNTSSHRAMWLCLLPLRTEGDDYVASNGTITIRAPTCSSSERLTIKDDLIFEKREGFHFTLTSNQPRVEVNRTLPHGDIVITDNDGEILSICKGCQTVIVPIISAGPLVVVGLLQTTYTVHEGEMVTICAQMMSGVISKPLVVTIETRFSPDLIRSEFMSMQGNL